MRTLIFTVCFFTSVVNGIDNKGCTFIHDSSPESKNGEAQISTLKGKRFVTEDELYTYDIGICATAVSPLPDGKETAWKNAGVLQIQKNNTTEVHVIGRINQTDIFAGPEWVMLEYEGGDTYGSHCQQEARRAKIMFICDETATEDKAVLLEEQNSKDTECYYLFEISTPVVCPPPQSQGKSGLSVGSILLIVFFSVVAVYLLAGCLYNRFVLKAKGLDQIPNLSFWEDFGNLQADGCDFVCRSRKSRQPRTYKGVGDDQLGETEHTNTDDNLLPM